MPKKGRPFEPGKSGNLAGRPKGIVDRRLQYRDLIQFHAPALIDKAIQLALHGDTTALRLCIDRLIPPIKAR